MQARRVWRVVMLCAVMTGVAGMAIAQSSAPSRGRGGVFVMPDEVAGGVASSQDVGIDVRPALSAAVAWLVLTDDGLADKSWEAAAPLFRQSLSASAWQQALQAARAPLGHVISRKIASAAFTRVLPGVPDGEYVVIQYETVFQNKAQATETVTSARGSDGHWRVAGYLIK